MLKTKWWLLPIIYIAVIWLMFGVQKFFKIQETLALYPKDTNHLLGVFTTVFLHSDLLHLVSNTLPLLGCMLALFYFYKDISLRVLFISHIVTGLLIWIIARPAFHIGASGLVYALVLFLLVSGFIRKNKQLSFLALAVLSIQSGLIWGVLPQQNGISWESHLIGGIVGATLAFIYKHKGPQADKPYHWNEDENKSDEYKHFE